MTHLNDQTRLDKRNGLGAVVVAAIAFLSLLAIAGFAFWGNQPIVFDHLAKERNALPATTGQAR